MARSAPHLILSILGLAGCIRLVMRISGALATYVAPIPASAPFSYVAVIFSGVLIYGIISAWLSLAAQRLVLTEERPSTSDLFSLDGRLARYAALFLGFLAGNLLLTSIAAAVFAVTSGADFNAGVSIGSVSARVAWPILILATSPLVIIPLSRLAADDGARGMGRGSAIARGNRLRLLATWFAAILIPLALWYVVCQMIDSVFGAIRPPFFHRWLIDIANLSLVAALATAASVIYKELARTQRNRLAHAFD